MAFFSRLRSRPLRGWTVFVGVGLALLLVVTSVGKALYDADEEQIGERFRAAATNRAARVGRYLVEQIDNVATAQRLFTADDLPSADAFQVFTEPLVNQTNISLLAWLPAVDAAQRERFEADARGLWGEHFSISDVAARGGAALAAPARCFPVFYVAPLEANRWTIGRTFDTFPKHLSVIEQAIDAGAPIVSGPSPAFIEHWPHGSVVVIAPVYRREGLAATVEARRSAIRGVVMAVVKLTRAFDEANQREGEAGLRVRLLDRTLAAEERLVHAWPADIPASDSPAATALRYEHRVVLGGRPWAIEVEATAAWRDGNASSALRYAPAVGALFALVLLSQLSLLFKRRTLASKLFRELSERRSAEAWTRKLSLAVEQNPATIVITDLEGNIEYVNERFVQTTGYAKAEVLGRNPRILKSGRTDTATYADLWATIKSGQVWRGEFENRRRDGTLYQERAMIAPIQDTQGKTASYIAIKEDITELRRMIDRLHESESRFRSVVSVMAEGLMVCSDDGGLIFANPAAEEIFANAQTRLQSDPSGESGTEKIRQDGTPFPPEERPWIVAIREGREVRGVVMGLRSRDGSLRWILINASPLISGKATQPNAAVATFTDITERKAAQQRVEFLAHHDALTELPNRVLLRDRVEQAMAAAKRSHTRLALMFLDLDRFKTINDSLGHPTGDKLLRAIVERLKTCVRESDTISRQGGDEFVILLRDARDGDAVSRLADKIHRRMSEPFLIETHALSTSFSIGIAMFPDDGDNFDDLTQKADTAMYHAKHAGRNAHRFFTEQMNVQVVEHMKLETELRQALERQEFILHYQPQIHLQTGEITGVEALARWRSPEHGIVGPARFIPIAEETGLIVPIGKWVIGEACRQARAWQDAGLPAFSVAVNLSAMQYRRSDLVDTVINALVLAEIDSRWLELELTESILIDDSETALETARRLKAIGVRLSVDDFGTGYSSLAYLKRFAVDKLKVAQPFVRDVVSDADDAAIVRAIIQMAHSLKLCAIAEGVETAEQAERLRSFACDEIQGYWLARPMPAEDLAAFVRARQAS